MLQHPLPQLSARRRRADVSGSLRAQREGSGTGRVYTLAFTVMDVAGNTSTCEVHVTVPHDQGS